MIGALRLLCAAMLLTAPFVAAKAQQPAPADAAAVQTPGYRLAMVTNPLSCFDIEPGSPAAIEVARLIRAEPANQEAEADYPGFIDYAIEVIVTHTRNSRDRMASETWAALAPLFDRNLTPIQLSQASSFYATEAGQRLVIAMCNSTDARLIGEALQASGDYTLTADAVARSHRNAAEALTPGIAALPARDRAAIQWFSQTDAARALAALRPQMFAIVAEVSNRPDAEFEAAITRDIERFFERVGKGGKPPRTP